MNFSDYKDGQEHYIVNRINDFLSKSKINYLFVEKEKISFT